MIPARKAVCAKVMTFAPLVDAACGKNFDRWLVLAVIAQESLGNPYAIRVERAFYERYLQGLIDLVKSTVSSRDDYWFRYPDIFSSSIGLMQTLYPVALELGFTFEYPTELCDPAKSIAVGVTKLRRCFKPMGADAEPIRAALLRYNGGGDSRYPDNVLRWRADLMTFASESNVV